MYITHNLTTIPFKFIIGNSDAKQYRLSLKLQLSGQIQLCLVWLQNVSRRWPMHAVARLEIWTMRIGLNIIVLLHITLFKHHRQLLSLARPTLQSSV